MPSSAQIELATYKLVASSILAFDLLDHADAAYYYYYYYVLIQLAAAKKRIFMIEEGNTCFKLVTFKKVAR